MSRTEDEKLIKLALEVLRDEAKVSRRRSRRDFEGIGFNGVNGNQPDSRDLKSGYVISVEKTGNVDIIDVPLARDNCKEKIN